MKNSEKPTSKETSLDDSIRLAIRDEVEKRVEQREALYWKFGGLLAVVVALFFTFLWRVSVSEIRETVEKQLAEKEVVKARDRIMVINSAAEDINRNLVRISSSMNTNQEQFMNRFSEIRQQDNVVLTEDLSKLFVVEKIGATNFPKLSLGFEPIPQTLKIFLNGTAEFLNWDRVGFLDKKIFTFTNKNATNGLGNDSYFKFEYVRKSLH